MLVSGFQSGVLLLSQPLYLAGELRSSAIDPRLHRPLRQVELVRDFLVRQFLDVSEHDGGAQRRRQLVERVSKHDDAVRALETRVGRQVRRDGTQLGRIDVAADRLALLADAAIAVSYTHLRAHETG